MTHGPGYSPSHRKSVAGAARRGVKVALFGFDVSLGKVGRYLVQSQRTHVQDHEKCYLECPAGIQDGFDVSGKLTCKKSIRWHC
jgi:hypothetical protein